MKALVSTEVIEQKILLIQGEKVLLDKDLARKLEELERKYDGQFRIVFDAIRQLIEVEDKPKRRIGYVRESRAVYRTSRKKAMARK